MHITRATTPKEVSEFLQQQQEEEGASGGGVVAANRRVRNPAWFETATGQHLATAVALAVYSPVVGWYIVSSPNFGRHHRHSHWLVWLAWWLLVGAITLALHYAAAMLLLPRRLLFGNSPAQFAGKLTLWVLFYGRAHVAIKVLVEVALVLVAIIGPSVYYPLFFARRLGEDNTLLHVALFQQCRLSVLEALVLTHGANVSAKNSQGDTPLHFSVQQSASSSSLLHAVQLLLNNGADVNAENYARRIPLEYATKPAVAECLLRHGSRVNDKWRPLAVELNLASGPGMTRQDSTGGGGCGGVTMQVPSDLAKRHVKPGETLCFLSHHKRDAAVVAVYLHGVLAQKLHCDSTSQVFLDSNELDDLRELGELVKRTKVLVVLQTPLVMSRPFCLVEMFTAIENNIPIVPVLIEHNASGEGGVYDFEYNRRFLQGCDSGDGASFRQELEARNPGAAASLESAGYDVQRVGAAIGAVVPNLISRPFNPAASERVRGSQLDDVCAAIAAAVISKKKTG